MHDVIAGGVVGRLLSRTEEKNFAAGLALFRPGQPVVGQRTLPAVLDDAGNPAGRIVEDQRAGLLEIGEGEDIGDLGIGGQNARARHEVVEDNPVRLAGLAVGDAGPLDAQQRDCRQGPLVELGGALEILNVEQLLDALLGRQSSLKLDRSHARFDARWQPVWQRSKLSKLNSLRCSGKSASRLCLGWRECRRRSQHRRRSKCRCAKQSVASGDWGLLLHDVLPSTRFVRDDGRLWPRQNAGYADAAKRLCGYCQNAVPLAGFSRMQVMARTLLM